MAKNPFAGIEYQGVAGSTQECEAAVVRLLQGGAHLKAARIVSCGNTHGLILTNAIGDQVAVKTGFSSGYGGTGPAGLSYVLALLYGHGVEVDEIDIKAGRLARLEQSALTLKDLDAINAAPAIRPTRWMDYISKRDHQLLDDKTLWRWFPSIIPYAVVDPRIMDLALAFWTNPDAQLGTGYRRLEDSVRTRTALTLSSSALFSKAFHPEFGPLTWEVPDLGELPGRLQLFTGAVQAFRNPRAHREHPESDLLAEFLLLNQLYRLEADAIAVADLSEAGRKARSDSLAARNKPAPKLGDTASAAAEG